MAGDMYALLESAVRPGVFVVNSLRLLSLLGALGMMLIGARAAEEGPAQIPIEITADGDNKFENGLATASGNVVIKYGGDTLYADKASYDPARKEVLAEGNVRLYSGTEIFRGDRLVFNFETKAVMSSNFRLVDNNLLTGGSQASTPGTDHYRIKNGIFTTDNRQVPAWRMQAGTVEIYAENEVVLKNVVFYVGDVPVMWVPIYVQSLNDDRANFQIDAGANSKFGPFILGTYNWYDSKKVRGAVHLDARAKRGLAGGADLELRPNAESIASLRTYYAHDNDPNYNPASLPRTGVNENRYRLALESRTALGYDLNILTDIDILSDPYMTRDFFTDEFQKNPMPDNVIELTQYNPTFTASLLVRQQFNPWYETVERSPELKIETKEQKIFNLPISYLGESSLANLSRQFPDGSGSPDRQVYRYDTFHQLMYPRQYFNWLNITPRAAVRGTYYYRENFDPRPVVAGLARPDKDEGRIAPLLGLETSFKVSKTWTDAKDSTLGIDGIRHVAEPFMNAQYVPTPDTRPRDILGFDNYVANTRLPEINQPAFNSIDSIDKQMIIRHGVRNKIQTKRDGKNWDLIDWAIYADADFERQFNNHLYSNVNNEVKIKPLPWITLDSYASKDLYGGGFDVFDNGVKWQVTPSTEIGAGNRILSDSVLYPDSNLFYLTAFYRMNEHWQFETTHYFEGDDGTLELQQYRVYRDLSAWQLAMTLEDRNNRGGKNEQIVYFSLTLKAFPNQEISINSK